MTLLESAARFGAATHERHVRRWVVAVVVGLLIVGGAWAVWFSGWLTAREVRIVGAVNVSADQVRQAAAVPAGQQLARVDVEGIAARVGQIPRVAAVEVRRGWPDVLVVVVTERAPLVVVRDGAEYVYLDATGARFGSTKTVGKGLPVVTARDDDALASALAVVAALPNDLRSVVESVDARTLDDVELALRTGATVQWGSADRSDRKTVVLRSLLAVGAQRYDVSAPDLPTTRGSLSTKR